MIFLGCSVTRIIISLPIFINAAPALWAEVPILVSLTPGIRGMLTDTVLYSFSAPHIVHICNQHSELVNKLINKSVKQSVIGNH